MARWRFVLLVGVFSLAAAVAATDRAEADCAGTDCCCDVEQNQCMAACPGYGQPGHFDCVQECLRGYQRCAICCCCQCYECPSKYDCGSWIHPSCGGFLLSGLDLQSAPRCVPTQASDQTGRDQCLASSAGHDRAFVEQGAVEPTAPSESEPR